MSLCDCDICVMNDLREILRCPERKDIREHAQMVMDDLKARDELVWKLRNLGIEDYSTIDQHDYTEEVE